MTVPTLPKPAEWQRAAEAGEAAVRAAIGEKGQRRLARGAPHWDTLALGFGAMKASTEFLHAVVPDDARAQASLEWNLLAIVRGVCRGYGYPINADNSPFNPDGGPD